MEVTSASAMTSRPGLELRWSWLNACPAWARLEGLALKLKEPPLPAVGTLVTVRSVPTP